MQYDDIMIQIYAELMQKYAQYAKIMHNVH